MSLSTNVLLSACDQSARLSRLKNDAPSVALKRATHVNLQSQNLQHIRGLEQCRNVKTVYLNYNALSELPEEVFKELTILEQLFVESNKLTDESIDGMVRAAKSSGNYMRKTLRTLSLDGNSLTYFHPLLQEFQGLQELRMSRQKLPPSIEFYIPPEATQFLSLLRILDLSGNRITDVSNLSSITSLQELDISNNSIESVSNISELVAQLPNLEVLVARGNPCERNSIADSYRASIIAASGIASIPLSSLDGTEVTEAHRVFMAHKVAIARNKGRDILYPPVRRNSRSVPGGGPNHTSATVSGPVQQSIREATGRSIAYAHAAQDAAAATAIAAQEPTPSSTSYGDDDDESEDVREWVDSRDGMGTDLCGGAVAGEDRTVDAWDIAGEEDKYRDQLQVGAAVQKSSAIGFPKTYGGEYSNVCPGEYPDEAAAEECSEVPGRDTNGDLGDVADMARQFGDVVLGTSSSSSSSSSPIDPFANRSKQGSSQSSSQNTETAASHVLLTAQEDSAGFFSTSLTTSGSMATAAQSHSQSRVEESYFPPGPYPATQPLHHHSHHTHSPQQSQSFPHENSRSLSAIGHAASGEHQFWDRTLPRRHLQYANQPPLPDTRSISMYDAARAPVRTPSDFTRSAKYRGSHYNSPDNLKLSMTIAEKRMEERKGRKSLTQPQLGVNPNRDQSQTSHLQQSSGNAFSRELKSIQLEVNVTKLPLYEREGKRDYTIYRD